MTRRCCTPTGRSGTGLAALGACALLLALPGTGTARAPSDQPGPATATATATATGASHGAPADGTSHAAPDSTGLSDAASSGELRTRLGRRQAEAVERHIQSLHRALRITPDQEALWKKLTEAMRQSVVRLDEVYQQREAQYGAMSAVDNLRSYAEVQETHARNVRSLMAPFEALYASFSDAQKHTADETFRKLTDSAVRGAR